MIKTPAANQVNVGDIFCHSWGYDQTNIAFYQVTAKTATTIRLCRIKANHLPSSDMTGVTVPILNAFIIDDTDAFAERGQGRSYHIKRPYTYPPNAYLPGVWVPAVHGAGQLWDGHPMAYSNYH